MPSFATRFVVLFLLVFARSAVSAQLTHYAVILEGEPASSAHAAGRQAMALARAGVMSSHAPVRAALAARKIRVTGEVGTLLNAIFVVADPADVAAIAALPGVKQVAPLKRFHLTLDHAEQLINVPAAWNLAGGLSSAGAGIKIGIIDSGIEATHVAFQNAPLTPPSGFPICPVASDCAFTNDKIIVARSYVSLLNSFAALSSRPDDTSVRDRIGHGTAVAMAAAGLTATGPSDTITGVAPGAFIGVYKVFGSPGVNDFTTGDAVISAVEDAYSDQMDIVVLSLGAPALSGPLDTGTTCGLTGTQVCDPEATTMQAAVNLGLVVVVAAGNDGQSGLTQPGLNTMDSPGDAPGAIAAAATTNSHNWSNQLTVNGLGTFHSLFGSGPIPTATFGGPMGDVASVGDPLACTAPPAGSLNGLVVLVARGACTFTVKVQNLQAAGAIAAVITNNPGDDTLLAPSAPGTAIPDSFVGYDDGQSIRAYLATHAAAAVAINPNLVASSVTTYNQMTAFSSRGPVVGTNALKPDVGAVGESLYLAGQTYDPNGELYTTNGFLVSQGTSFSTPQIAGVAALVKQAIPSFSAANYSQALAIKSAVVNSATQDVTDGGPAASVMAIGAGKANAGFAVTTQLLANPTSVSFGVITGSLPITQQIQLTNISLSTLNLTLALNRRTVENKAQTSISPAALTLAAGQTGSVSLVLSGSAPTPGIYEGLLVITGAANPVTIPYLYLVGNGQPYNMLSLAGNGDDGSVGQQTTGGFVVFKIVDQFGVPVQNAATTFNVVSGGGQLLQRTTRTDNYGLGYAQSILGTTPGANVYTATVGSLTTTFTATGRLQPTIQPAGVVNAGNFTQGVAPGSYVSLFGVALSDTSQGYATGYLPVSINNVSVSFDSPTSCADAATQNSPCSVPGHLTYVSPGQVNVQIPWELQGAASVQMKVTNNDSAGAVFTLPLASYSPAFFEIQGIAAALDQNNNVVTASNPVAQGSVVQLFANGLGPVSNQPASGDPSPAAVLALTTTTPTVTIGGRNAQVQFSGLTPTDVGLYQLNVVVPNTGTGLQPVTISIGNVTSTISHLPVQ